jgi:MoxR-like ATPase
VTGRAEGRGKAWEQDGPETTLDQQTAARRRSGPVTEDGLTADDLTADGTKARATPRWWVYRGTGVPHDGISRLPEPPPWRRFGKGEGDDRDSDAQPVPHTADGDRATGRRLGRDRKTVAYRADEREVNLVNLALHLRRPLLVTGKPGVGKSTLADAVAHELGLGPVLRWPITSRSTLQDGLYQYDAIGRLHDGGLPGGGVARRPGRQRSGMGRAPGKALDIGKYLRLGPLGTALLPWQHPRVLLIDEIDKSDIDLPNDLLNVFEEGEFTIPELSRLGDRPRRVMTSDTGGTAVVRGGAVGCAEFPFVVLTSNDEREFPMAFLRRCIRLDIRPAEEKRLAAIIASHLGPASGTEDVRKAMVTKFLERQRTKGTLANDQLLNAVLMAERGLDGGEGLELIHNDLLRPLDEG